MRRRAVPLRRARGDRLLLEEEAEVVGAPRLAAGARHVVAAEGLRADQGARALAVEVEVPDVEAALGLGEVRGVLRVDGAREPELGPVRDRERVLPVLGADHGEDGPEDLLLREARGR